MILERYAIHRLCSTISVKCRVGYAHSYEERAMTLAELLPAIRQLPALDKLRLIRILAEELDTAEDIAPFEPHKVYYLPTPYNTFGAGSALMQAMQQTDSPTD